MTKYFVADGIKYGCKVLEEYLEDGLKAIRINSNCIYNLYFWKDGYKRPEPHKGNVKEFPDNVVLKAFGMLKDDFTVTNNTKTVNNLIVNSDIGLKMFKVTDNAGTVAMFTSADDVVRHCIGKCNVTIEEVIVSYTNVNATKTKEVVKEVTKEEVKEIKEEVKEIKEEVKEVDKPISNGGLVTVSKEILEDDSIVPPTIKHKRNNKASADKPKTKGRVVARE